MVWNRDSEKRVPQAVKQLVQPQGKLYIPVTNRKHSSEKTSLTYQQIKKVTMKKTNFKLNFVANLVVALSVFVGAGGAQYICARSNASSS